MRTYQKGERIQARDQIQTRIQHSLTGDSLSPVATSSNNFTDIRPPPVNPAPSETCLHAACEYHEALQAQP